MKSLNCPSQIKELTPFENDLLELVKTVKFRKNSNKFQRQLKADIKLINNTTATLTCADKTTNIYKLPRPEYQKLMNNAITTSYKKVSNKMQDQINK